MIEVVETPPLNIVVDQGRSRARCYGIGRSGAMDRPALAVGNALLGNAADAAGIEFQLYPVRLRFLVERA
jgi:allophanate hydrolase subunit 2